MVPESERVRPVRVGSRSLEVEEKGRMLGFGSWASRGLYTLCPFPLFFLYTLCPFPRSRGGVEGEEGERERREDKSKREWKRQVEAGISEKGGHRHREKRIQNNGEMEESEMKEKNRDTAEKLDTELETGVERSMDRKQSKTGRDRQGQTD